MRALLIAWLIVLYACNDKHSEAISPVVQNITESVYGSGIVKSREQYEVFSAVNGIMSQQRVNEGDIVRKGDVIATLVNEAAKLSSENAGLAAAYYSATLNADRLRELKIKIDLARAKMRQDSALLQRQRNLWNQDIGSRNELEQKELAWKSSVTSYQAAVLEYNDLQRSIDFAAQQSAKNLQISNTVNRDYSIRARQDGRVYKFLKEPGEMVNTQTPVAVIGKTHDFVVELRVDEYDIGKIKPGQKVFVRMDSYKGQVFEATVTKLQPMMEDRSRSFLVEAVFTSRPAELYPNLTVEANILISTKANALTIPRSYLVEGNYVLLKNGDKRKVITGLMDFERVEILSGITKDDAIKKPER